MCLCSRTRTPLCSVLAIFGDLPAKHSIHLLDQLWAHVFNTTTNLCKHQLALKASSLHKGRNKTGGLFSCLRCVKSTNSFRRQNNNREGTFRGPMNSMKGKEVLLFKRSNFSLTYLSNVFWRSLRCAVQIHVGVREHNATRFLHLDERNAQQNINKRTEKSTERTSQTPLSSDLIKIHMKS